MPNKEISVSMKNQFSSALKKRLSNMPFDKITVTDLANDCGVNRQTFYYHFTDIYDLMDWCFKNEAETILRFNEEPFDWKESVRKLIKYIDENHAFCLSVLNSMSHRILKKIFTDEIDILIRKVVSSYEPTTAVNEEAKEFQIKFYSMAVGGLIEGWVLGEFNISSEKLIGYIESIIIKNIGDAVPSQSGSDNRTPQPIIGKIDINK